MTSQTIAPKAIEVLNATSIDGLETKLSLVSKDSLFFKDMTEENYPDYLKDFKEYVTSLVLSWLYLTQELDPTINGSINMDFTLSKEEFLATANNPNSLDSVITAEYSLPVFWESLGSMEKAMIAYAFNVTIPEVGAWIYATETTNYFMASLLAALTCVKTTRNLIGGNIRKFMDSIRYYYDYIKDDFSLIEGYDDLVYPELDSVSDIIDSVAADIIENKDDIDWYDMLIRFVDGYSKDKIEDFENVSYEEADGIQPASLTDPYFKEGDLVDEGTAIQGKLFSSDF